MSESATLEFESARTLAGLFANDLKLLKAAEDTLGVKLTTREGWLRADGEGEGIQRVQALFGQLDRARNAGVAIRKPEFLYALKSVSQNDRAGLDELAATKIQCSPKRAPVFPKTDGQVAYIKAIQTLSLIHI